MKRDLSERKEEEEEEKKKALGLVYYDLLEDSSINQITKIQQID